MKKLLTLLASALLLFAFSSLAAAESIYLENFHGTSYGMGQQFSDNWQSLNEYGATIRDGELQLYTATTSKAEGVKFTLNPSFDLQAGVTYTVSFTGYAMDTNKEGVSTWAKFYADLGHGSANPYSDIDFSSGDVHTITIYAASDSVASFYFTGDFDQHYRITSFEISNDVAATPIPGVAILLAPGLVGLGVLRRKMK